MTVMRLKRYPSASGGIALGKVGVGATMMRKRTQVEYLSYIQSDGSAWVDTGYIPQYYDSFELEMAATVWSSSSVSGKTAFFGCLPSTATSPYSTEPGYVFSPIFADRQYAFLPPFSNVGGGNARFWNGTPNDGNAYLDGTFRTFTLSAYANSVPSAIVVDGTNTVSLTQRGFAGGTSSQLAVSVALFGSKTELGTCIFKTSTQSNFKFRRLKFFDANGLNTADIRAAKLGNEFGIFDDVSQTFHAGVDGIITGEPIP